MKFKIDISWRHLALSLIIVNVIQLYLLLQTNKKYDSILRSAIEQSNTYV